MNEKMSKVPKIQSPPRKTSLTAHGSTTTLASQISNESSRSSLSGFTTVPKFSRSSTCQRLRPRTIASPTPALKLHKLGCLPAYLRRNRPASSPADVESKQNELKLEQLDSGVGGEQLDSGVVMATGRPEGSSEMEAKIEAAVEYVKKEQPKQTSPTKRGRILMPKDPVKLEQNEAFQKLTNRVGELETELAQKNVEYATLAQSNATLTQDNAAMVSRVEALEKLLKQQQPELSTESADARNFRKAVQASVRKHDEALVGLRNMLLNSVVVDAQPGQKSCKPAKLDEAKLLVLKMQIQESSE